MPLVYPLRTKRKRAALRAALLRFFASSFRRYKPRWQLANVAIYAMEHGHNHKHCDHCDRDPMQDLSGILYAFTPVVLFVSLHSSLLSVTCPMVLYKVSFSTTYMSIFSNNKHKVGNVKAFGLYRYHISILLEKIE